LFKNLTLYRIAPDWSASFEQVQSALAERRFSPCGATEEKSSGWVEPRGEAHGPLAESVAQQIILKFQAESKAVPGAVVRKHAQAAADEIETQSGRKPGKKEMRQLRDDAKLALLPMAFARQSSTWVWIDAERRLLITDAGSQARTDDLITALVEALPGLNPMLVQTTLTPAHAMAQWLLAATPDEWPSGLSVERECELQSSDEEKSVVRYTRHHLINDEVRQHLQRGLHPKRLAMSWEGRVAFVLTESMQLKKIGFLDGVIAESGHDDSGFDADVAISTGELRQLIPDLIEALGGERVPGAGPADANIAA
jgi:recombination associated protein RdgC